MAHPSNEEILQAIETLQRACMARGVVMGNWLIGRMHGGAIMPIRAVVAFGEKHTAALNAAIMRATALGELPTQSQFSTNVVPGGQTDERRS